MPTLYTYQEAGVEFLRRAKRAILGDDMGLGKTVQALVASKDEKKILVITLNSVKETWRREALKWVPQKTVQVVAGDRTTRRAQIRAGADIVIINYELLTNWETIQKPFPPECHKAAIREVRSRGEVKYCYHYDLGELLRIPWDTVILDEAHKAKNRHSQTVRMLKYLIRPAKIVFLLTGTPILNRPDELWSLLNLLYPQEYSSYWRFVHQYCQVTHNGWGFVVGPPTLTQLRALKHRISPIFLRRTKSEVLDLPPKTIQQVWLNLEGTQARLYRDMATKMWAELREGKRVTTAYVIAQLTRLKQIVVAPEILWSDEPTISGVKIDALLDILDGSGDQKVVVFSQFVQALCRLKVLLEQRGYSTAILTGDVTGSSRDREIHRFQEDPRVKVILVSIRAGGVGITLSAASIGVFLDKDWTPAINIQAQDRLHRIGQQNPVTIIELLTSGTVEEGIERLLQQKQWTFQSLFKSDEIRSEKIPMTLIKDLLDPQGRILR